MIHNVVEPEGPIYIKRWDPSKSQAFSEAEPLSISTEMLARVAKSLTPDKPVNLERLLASSYNTRSALEALLAHTPEFYYCFPGRVDSYSGEIKRGHKHLMWCPDDPHELGKMFEKETKIIISETTVTTSYNAVEVMGEFQQSTRDINLARQHARIQVALVLIGQQLGYRSWVAKNDQTILYNEQPITKIPTVIDKLENEPLLGMFSEAVRAASLIDCIWFGNARYMPAVMEVEHSTGVTSGLTRMQNFQNTIPSIRTRYVIVAADELRQNVVEKANREMFRDLEVRFLPYSSVDELYYLCTQRKIEGIEQKFLDSYMEKIVY